MGFNCELMADPVVASDGRTYERYDIEKWMKTHDVSPLTNGASSTNSLLKMLPSAT